MTLSGISCKVPPSTRISNRSGGFKFYSLDSAMKMLTAVTVDKSCGWASNFISMVELRKKILSFRDIIDLPPCDAHGPIKELLMGTVGDLHNLYPKIVPVSAEVD